MIQVDFYLLPTDNPKSRQLLACRLTEKAYRLGYKVLICTESEDQDRTLDDLLWSFRAGSFVPHSLCTGPEVDRTAPVLIGHSEETENKCDVLINLSSTIPGNCSQFDRIVELIDQDDKIRQAGRHRYRFYQKQGYALKTHKLDAI